MKNNAAPIHAILGTDDFEVKRVARELAAQLAPPGDFGKEIINGQAGNADDAAQRVYQTIEALNTFGFFGGAKLVWLKDANFFADDRTGGAQTTMDAIEKLTALLQRGLPDGTRFLLSGGAIDKRRTFYKTLGKIGEVQTFDRLDTTKQGWERMPSSSAATRPAAGTRISTRTRWNFSRSTPAATATPSPASWRSSTSTSAGTTAA